MTETLTRATQPAPGVTRRVLRQRRRQLWRDRMIPVLLLLLGAVVLVYPVGATFYNNYKQTEFARDYATKVAATDPMDLRAELARARRYNAGLRPELLRDPWNEAKATTDANYQEYLTQLDLLDTMARIRIPSLKVDLPVLHGTSDDALAKGVGHFFGTALPVGGPGTHAVLTGHSSLSNATLFDHLDRLTEGDEFYIEVLGDTIAYRVDKITIVLPDQLDGLASTPGADHLTLVTCTPHAVNSHRLLVRATRIPYSPVHEAGPTGTIAGVDLTIQSWMWPRLLGAAAAIIAVIAMIIGWVLRDRKRARDRERKATLAAAARHTDESTPT
ncbi:MAG: class C sortase [Dermatophilaceae bacterium]